MPSLYPVQVFWLGTELNGGKPALYNPCMIPVLFHLWSWVGNSAAATRTQTFPPVLSIPISSLPYEHWTLWLSTLTTKNFDRTDIWESNVNINCMHSCFIFLFLFQYNLSQYSLVSWVLFNVVINVIPPTNTFFCNNIRCSICFVEGKYKLLVDQTTSQCILMFMPASLLNDWGGGYNGCGHLSWVSPGLLWAVPWVIGTCQVLWRSGFKGFRVICLFKLLMSFHPNYICLIVTHLFCDMYVFSCKIEKPIKTI